MQRTCGGSWTIFCCSALTLKQLPYRVLLTALKPQIRLSSIILMDATIGATVTQEGDRMVMILTQVVWSKPDTWRTRDDARKWISAAPGYKTWDPRVLQLYVASIGSIPIQALRSRYHVYAV